MGRGNGETAQSVVAAELEDDDLRTMLFERSGKPGAPAAGRLAAYAGIDDTVPSGRKALLEQGNPPLARAQTIGGAQAVAEYEDGFLPLAGSEAGAGKEQAEQQYANDARHRSQG